MFEICETNPFDVLASKIDEHEGKFNQPIEHSHTQFVFSFSSAFFRFG